MDIQEISQIQQNVLEVHLAPCDNASTGGNALSSSIKKSFLRQNSKWRSHPNSNRDISYRLACI